MGRGVQRVKFAQFSMSHTKVKEDYKKKCFVKISTLLLGAVCYRPKLGLFTHYFIFIDTFIFIAMCLMRLLFVPTHLEDYMSCYLHIKHKPYCRICPQSYIYLELHCVYLTIYYNHFGVELQQTMHKYSEKQCCWREKYVWNVGSRCYGVILCEKETDGCKKRSFGCFSLCHLSFKNVCNLWCYSISHNSRLITKDRNPQHVVSLFPESHWTDWIIMIVCLGRGSEHWQSKQLPKDKCCLFCWLL